MTNIEDLQIAIVAPLHIKPTDEWIRCLDRHSKGKHQIIIVDDSKEQNIVTMVPASWEVYNREQQHDYLGDDYDAFTQFQGSSSCKNFGHIVAYKSDADVIIGLDSDCNVPMNFVGMHLEALMLQAHGWTNPLENLGLFSRGYPYVERSRRVIANMGLWENELDMYGTDRIGIVPPKHPRHTKTHAVADGFIPFSGMNWACWRDAIPGLMFIPNFEYKHGDTEYRFRRCDDIWGGYIFQKFMEKKNERICYGDPVVWHDTIVVPEEDAAEEVGMIEFENMFYTAVDQILDQVTVGGYDDMMYQFSVLIQDKWKGTEWEPLIAPIKFWTIVI